MKKISVIGSIIVIGIVVISLGNTKKEMKPTIDNKKLAVFIKQNDGTYKTSTSIPKIGYTLNQEKSTCSNGATPTWINKTLNISNLTSENTNCYLYFDEDAATKKLKELNLTANTTTPDFSQVATTDEGIFGVEDGMYGGTSYYWRGATTTNYVKFAGFCWRIIRINGDGSLRLIYDGSTCHENGTSTEDSIAVANQTYYESRDRSEYVGYTFTEGSQRGTTTSSNLKIQNETWYGNNLKTYESKIADGKFCNDRNVASGFNWSSQPNSTFHYAGLDRRNGSPTLSCSNANDIYALKIGAITMDEVLMAGGKFYTTNSSYYLYSGHYFWTMSPYYLYFQTDNSNRFAVSFFVGNNGELNVYCVADSLAVRPVINLRSDVTLTGNGTIDNPFIVEGAE